QYEWVLVMDAVRPAAGQVHALVTGPGAQPRGAGLPDERGMLEVPGAAPVDDAEPGGEHVVEEGAERLDEHVHGAGEQDGAVPGGAVPPDPADRLRPRPPQQHVGEPVPGERAQLRLVRA